MRNNRKRGFTLVEAVICVAIIGVLAMGYMYLTGGSANIFKAGTEYDRKTSELIKAAHDGLFDENITQSTEEGAIRLQLSDNEEISLDRVTLSGGANEGNVYYYRYSVE